MTEVLWADEQSQIRLSLAKQPPGALVKLLADTEWGTREVKYRVHGIRQILARMKDPYFLILESNGSIVGGVVCSRKTVTLANRPCDALFIAMVAVATSAQGKGYGSLLARKAKEFGRSLLGEPGIIYLYIESTNTASLSAHKKVGYQSIGELEARLFTRILPRSDPDVRKPRKDERAKLVALLGDQYADHALLDFEDALQTGGAYVLERDGELIASAQVRLMHWSLEKLRGCGGFMALEVLPRVPIIRRKYSPKHLRFLRIGNIFFRRGRERELTHLLETLLARAGLNVGMIFEDKRSGVYEAMKGGVRFGALGGLALETAEILADFRGLTAEEVAAARSRPAHISLIDPM